MKLSEYIKAERGNATDLASQLDISLSQLSQYAANSDSISPARCVLIEQFTLGKVSRKDLRTHDWFLIWPELMSADEQADPSQLHATWDGEQERRKRIRRSVDRKAARDAKKRKEG